MINIEHREDKIRKKDSMREIKWKITKYRIWDIIMIHYRDGRKGDEKERRQEKGTILQVNEEKNSILRREEVEKYKVTWQ